MNDKSIRVETLQPASNWQKPTTEEIRELIRLTGLNGAEVADLLGLTPQGNKSGGGSRTVRRWTAGDVPIPYAAWAILAYVAGFGAIWVADE
nr:transcriptional regulator [Proteus mirabilis]